MCMRITKEVQMDVKQLIYPISEMQVGAYWGYCFMD